MTLSPRYAKASTGTRKKRAKAETTPQPLDIGIDSDRVGEPDVPEKDRMDEKTRVAVSTALHCLECRLEWTDPHERWRMYATLDEQPEVGLYCPVCAAFEFDG